MTRMVYRIRATHPLRRRMAHPNLHIHYLLGLEDELFTPAELAVRRSQRQSQLLYKLTRHQQQQEQERKGENTQDTTSSQATPGASPIALPPPLFTYTSLYDPYPSFSAARPHRPRPANIRTSLRRCKPPASISIALANTLLDLTSIPAKATDATHAAYADIYGQQYLVGEMEFEDVQILSRAGGDARVTQGRYNGDSVGQAHVR